MAILFADGFDHYALSDLGKKYDVVNAIADLSTAYGRFGSQGIKFTSTGQYLIKNLPASKSILVVGAAIYLPNLPPATGLPIFQFADNGNRQDYLRINPEGSIELMRGAYGNSGTSVAKSLPGIIRAQTWQYIECMIVINSITGSVEVHVNEQTVMKAIGINTQTTANAYVTQVQIGYVDVVSYAITWYCDDLLIDDANFHGDIRIETVLPNAAGNYAQWTPVGATANYACVNETPPNGDTTYISSSTVGAIDSFQKPAIPTNAGSIMGVIVNMCARKDDANIRQIAALTRQNLTDYVGNTITIGDSYIYYQQIWETNPATTTAWTISAVNGAEMGVKVIA
ncbi:MAG: hypothetical protein QXF82_00790 [Nitrososphaeria archaeon]